MWAKDEYLAGFIKFAQATLEHWPSWAPREEYLYIDQVSKYKEYLGPILHYGGAHIWKYLNGEVYCPILKNAQISREKVWPVIVFSHGLGCSRFANSRICADLASHGFVVAATEHRDGSAALSFTMENGRKSWVEHRQILDGEDEYTIRNNQVYFRAAELTRTMDLIEKLTARENVKNVLESADDLNMFQDMIQVENPILIGHSFGGSTALVSLVHDKRFKHGIILDGWLFPIKEKKMLTPDQPILFINTESFEHRENLAMMRSFMHEGLVRRMVQIKGSVHHNLKDVPLIFKSAIVKRMVGMQSVTDPLLVVDITNKLMLQFLFR